MEVPKADGTSESCTLSQGGDCAAAHSGGAIDSPVNRAGVCFRCTAKKKDWFNLDVIKKSPRRNFAYQCVANHINVYKLLGPAFADKAPPQCPHCSVVVDDALKAKEKAEWDAADEEGRKEITRKHAASHCGGLLGRAPIAPTDNRRRTRSALHRRMNASSNNITATFMKVPFDLKQRQAANAVLAKAKDVAWRFPEKKKKRASTPTGNSARAFHTLNWLLVDLFNVFYPDLSEEDTAALSRLQAAATAANGGAAPPRGAPGAAAPAPTARRGTKRKAVAPITTVGGKQMTAEEHAAYMADRRAAATGAPPPTRPLLAADAVGKLNIGPLRKLAEERGLSHTGVAKKDLKALLIAKFGATAAPAADTTDTTATEEPVDDTGVCLDDSLELELDQDANEEELVELEDEDEVMGNAASAIEVWRTSIIHQSDVYAPIANHFDMEERRRYGETGQASGRAWALALQARFAGHV